jgi:hypothetical protein
VVDDDGEEAGDDDGVELGAGDDAPIVVGTPRLLL